MNAKLRFFLVATVGLLAVASEAGERPFSFFGTAYYPEDRPRSAWASDLMLMRELGVDSVRIGEFNWCGFEPDEGRFDFGEFQAFLDELGRQGLTAMMCTPTAASPMWLIARYPQTEKRRADGTRPELGYRHTACATSPEYRAFSLRITTKMAEAFKDRPEIVAWQLENEPCIRGGSAGECFCDACKREFRLWLKRRYGTLEALNRAWHTSFWSARFTDWEQISPPFRSADRRNWERDYSRFHSDQTVSLLLAQRDILRKANPKWKITSNSPLVTGEFRYDELFAGLDFASADVYLTGGRPDAVDIWEWNVFRCFHGRPEPFVVGELGPFSGDATDPDSYAAVRPLVWNLVAHGADGLFWFCWNTSVAGEEMSNRILPWSGKPRRAFASVRRIREEFAALPAPIARLPLRLSRVAVLCEPETSQYHDTDEDALWRYFRHMHLQLTRACERFGIQPDVLPFTAVTTSLAPYDVVFLPPCDFLSERQIALLKDYVKGGGTIAAVTHQNLMDANGCYRTEPYPAGMLDLYGLEINEHRKLTGPGGKPKDVALDMPFGVFRAEGFIESLEPSTAEVLARYSSTCFKGDPVLTRNAYGKGRAYYLGCGADAAGSESFVRFVLSAAGIPTERRWPDSVTRAMRGKWTIVVNDSGATVTVPAERGRMIVGATSWREGDSLRLPAAEVAVFEQEK